MGGSEGREGRVNAVGERGGLEERGWTEGGDGGQESDQISKGKRLDERWNVWVDRVGEKEVRYECREKR